MFSELWCRVLTTPKKTNLILFMDNILTSIDSYKTRGHIYIQVG